jgi:hypothetical protein
MSAAAADDARARFSVDRQIDAYLALHVELAGTGTGAGAEPRSSPRVGGG